VTLLTSTDLSSKAQSVFDNVYRSIGGSGSNPDTATFRKQVETAESSNPQAIEKAWNEQVWNNLLLPYAQSGGQPLPSNIVDQVKILADAMHRTFSKSMTGASSRS
jgi:hypothetical protein